MEYKRKDLTVVAVQFNTDNFPEISDFVGKDNIRLPGIRFEKGCLQVKNGYDIWLDVHTGSWVMSWATPAKIMVVSHKFFTDNYEIFE
jgi:hypothetical protein